MRAARRHEPAIGHEGHERQHQGDRSLGQDAEPTGQRRQKEPAALEAGRGLHETG